MTKATFDPIENVEAVLDKEIKEGRVIGLSKFNGRHAKIVILKEPEPV